MSEIRLHVYLWLVLTYLFSTKYFKYFYVPLSTGQQLKTGLARGTSRFVWKLFTVVRFILNVTTTAFLVGRWFSSIKDALIIIIIFCFQSNLNPRKEEDFKKDIFKESVLWIFKHRRNFGK